MHPANGLIGCSSRNDVKEKIGPRVEVGKVNSADFESATPLDFLLGVMRDADSPPTLRLKVAGIVAPYVHRKGKPVQIDEFPVAMTVLDDPYGFDADIADKLDTIHREAKSSDDLTGVSEKAKETTDLEVANGVEEKQAALKCPPAYKELDSRKDRARLKELEAASKARPLTAAEKIEQKHLQARLEIYSRTPELADCDRMNFLKDLGPENRTLDEKEELERLGARYPEVPFDPTRARVLAAEFVRRIIIRRGLPPGSSARKQPE